MKQKSSVVGGLILIVIGAFFLLAQLFPGLTDWLNMRQQWPMIIVAIGGIFLVGAVLGTPGLAIPACVIGGTGVMLYWQNLTGNWASWAFTWTLYPGFVGLGMMLMAVLGGKGKGASREGMRLIIVSAGLFLLFGAFFSGFGRFWPLLLIISGIWLLIQNKRK